jgi:hypothetical protein
MHLLRLGTNKAFIYFNRATITTQLIKSTVLHCQPNPVEHKACGFLRYA